MLIIAHHSILLPIFNKNNSLILGEGPGKPEKTFSVNFIKLKTKFCLSSHDNGDDSYLYINNTESKGLDNINPCQICSDSVSEDFEINKTKEIALNDTVYDFSIDYGVIGSADALSILKYLMKKQCRNDSQIGIYCNSKFWKNIRCRKSKMYIIIKL